MSKEIMEKRRLSILQTLNDQPGFKINDQVIKMNLSAVGYPSSTDEVLSDLAFLERAEMIKVDDLPNGMKVAVLSEKGSDVANGLSQVPGIASPGPQRF